MHAASGKSSANITLGDNPSAVGQFKLKRNRMVGALTIPPMET